MKKLLATLLLLTTATLMATPAHADNDTPGLYTHRKTVRYSQSVATFTVWTRVNGRQRIVQWADVDGVRGTVRATLYRMTPRGAVQSKKLGGGKGGPSWGWTIQLAIPTVNGDDGFIFFDVTTGHDPHSLIIVWI